MTPTQSLASKAQTLYYDLITHLNATTYRDEDTLFQALDAFQHDRPDIDFDDPATLRVLSMAATDCGFDEE